MFFAGASYNRTCSASLCRAGRGLAQTGRQRPWPGQALEGPCPYVSPWLRDAGREPREACGGGHGLHHEYKLGEPDFNKKKAEKSRPP